MKRLRNVTKRCLPSNKLAENEDRGNVKPPLPFNAALFLDFSVTARSVSSPQTHESVDGEGAVTPEPSAADLLVVREPRGVFFYVPRQKG